MKNVYIGSFDGKPIVVSFNRDTTIFCLKEKVLDYYNGLIDEAKELNDRNHLKLEELRCNSYEEITLDKVYALRTLSNATVWCNRFFVNPYKDCEGYFGLAVRDYEDEIPDLHWTVTELELTVPETRKEAVRVHS